MDRRKALLEIARRRQRDRLDGFNSIGDYHNARYEADHVSPWTRSASNVDSPIMLVAQDWASHDYLAAAYRPYLRELGYDPSLATNRNLQKLIGKHLARPFSATFATNLFPFVKPGGMSSGISVSALRYSCREYLLPQIAVVEPRLVICLGAAAYGTLRATQGLERIGGIEDMIAAPFEIGRSLIVGVAHPGQLGTNNRGVLQVDSDWRALKKKIS